jgi:PAS domain S-box-containing protein
MNPDRARLEELQAEVERLRDQCRTLTERAGWFDQLWNAPGLGLIRHDAQGRVVEVNAGAVEILGRAVAQVVGRHWDEAGWKVVDERERDLTADALFLSRLDDGRPRGEVVFGFDPPHGGRRLWARATAPPGAAPNDRGDSSLMILHDVTAEKNQAESVRASQVKYKTIFDHFPLGISLTDENGAIVEANPASERILGLTQVEHTQRRIDGPPWRIIQPDGSPLPDRDFPSVRAFRENRRVEGQELGVVRPDGRTVWISVTAAPIDLPGLGVAIGYVDISERKRVEQDLATSRDELEVKVLDRTAELTAINHRLSAEIAERRKIERRLELALNVADLSWWEWDVDSGRVECDDRKKSMIGLAPDQGPVDVGGWVSLIHPHDREAANQAMRDHIAGRADYYEIDYRLPTRNNEWRWFYDRGQVVDRHQNGRPRRVIGLVMDITRRKRVERALADGEYRYRCLIEKANQGIVITQNRQIVFANPKALDYVGYSLEELLGRDVAEMLHPDDRDWVMEQYFQRLRGVEIYEDVAYRIINKHGRVSWLQTRSTRIDWEGRPAVFTFLVDVTRSKQIQQELQTALADRETLLTEVHHRVKNNLQIIISLLNLQRERIADPEVRLLFEEGQSRIRAMALIHETLYASGHLGKIDLADYLTRLVRHQMAAWGVSETRVRTHFDLTPVFLAIDQAVPCGLAVNELITNALKYGALPEGSTDIHVTAAQSGDEVNLAVADRGPGLPPDFDMNTHSGLGLTLVRSLIEGQLKGRLIIRPEPGARFEVSFKSR